MFYIRSWFLEVAIKLHNLLIARLVRPYGRKSMLIGLTISRTKWTEYCVTIPEMVKYIKYWYKDDKLPTFDNREHVIGRTFISLIDCSRLLPFCLFAMSLLVTISERGLRARTRLGCNFMDVELLQYRIFERRFYYKALNKYYPPHNIMNCWQDQHFQLPGES